MASRISFSWQRIAVAWWKSGAVWFVAVAAFCVLSMVAFDRSVAWFFKSHISGGVETFFKTVTLIGEGGAWFTLAALGFVGCRAMAASVRISEPVRLRLGHCARNAEFMFGAMLASGAVLAVVKFALGRYRPRELFNSGRYGFSPFNHDWGMNSFPSGHSQTIWAVMIVIALLFPRYRVVCILVAVLVSFSRVVISVHYLSDVAMGSYLGAAVTVWLYRRFYA